MLILISSGLENQCTQKAEFTCEVYKKIYFLFIGLVYEVLVSCKFVRKEQQSSSELKQPVIDDPDAKVFIYL